MTRLPDGKIGHLYIRYLQWVSPDDIRREQEVHAAAEDLAGALGIPIADARERIERVLRYGTDCPVRVREVQGV